MNARRFLEKLGEKEVLESAEQVSFGANEIRDGLCFSHQKRFQPLICSSDIMQLKPLNCYAKIANVDCVFKHEFSYLNLSIVANDFEARDRIELIFYTESDDNQKFAAMREKSNLKILDASISHQGKKGKAVNSIFEYKLTDPSIPVS
jgi:hypothetical protein